MTDTLGDHEELLRLRALTMAQGEEITRLLADNEKLRAEGDTLLFNMSKASERATRLERQLDELHSCLIVTLTRRS